MRNVCIGLIVLLAAAAHAYAEPPIRMWDPWDPVTLRLIWCNPDFVRYVPQEQQRAAQHAAAEWGHYYHNVCSPDEQSDKPAQKSPYQ